MQTPILTYITQLHDLPYRWDFALCTTARLPVSANIESPALRRKDAVVRLIEKTVLRENIDRYIKMRCLPAIACHHIDFSGQTIIP